MSHLKGSMNHLLWCLTGSSFDLVGFVDANYAGYLVDRKSTSGIEHFLGPCFVSMAVKKENPIALSTAKVGYVVIFSYCNQIFWIKQQLLEFRVKVDCFPIMYDNTTIVNIAKNLVHHKCTKNIDVGYHFLCDNIENRLSEMVFYKMEDPVADIFTKALA